MNVVVVAVVCVFVVVYVIAVMGLVGLSLPLLCGLMAAVVVRHFFSKKHHIHFFSASINVQQIHNCL